MSNLSIILTSMLFALSYYFMLGKSYFLNVSSFQLLIVGLIYYGILYMFLKRRGKKAVKMEWDLLMNRYSKLIIFITLVIIMAFQISTSVFHFTKASFLYLYPDNSIYQIASLMILIMLLLQFLKFANILNMFRRFAIYVLAIFVIIMLLFVSFNKEPLQYIKAFTFMGILEAIAILIVNNLYLSLIKPQKRLVAIKGLVIGLFVLCSIFFVNEQVFTHLNQNFLYSTIMLGNTFSGNSFILNIDILIGCAFLIIEIFKICMLLRILIHFFSKYFKQYHHYLFYFIFFFSVSIIGIVYLFNNNAIFFESMELVTNLACVILGILCLLIF